MVNPAPNVSYQQIAPQPSISTVTEPVVQPETIQPRSAPAGDSQRSDQRSLRSDSGSSQTKVSASESSVENERREAPSTSGRGRVVDITV